MFVWWPHMQSGHSCACHPCESCWCFLYAGGNTNIRITLSRLSRLHMQPPNKQLPCIIIINVLYIAFYHSTVIN